jgi:hypothetical protein
MVSIPKVVGLMSCGFLLCLGLSNAAQAEQAPGPSDVMKEGARTITGELSRVQDGDYFVKTKDGKEERFHIDKTTQMMGQIKKGDRIEATVNDKDRAKIIRLVE